MDEGSYCIRLQEVSKSFVIAKKRVFAIKEFSTLIRSGIITGIVGPDGAGKTTLLRLLSGMLIADHGKIEVLGLNPAQDKEALSTQIGYMPQNFGLYEDLTVEENLELYAELYRIAKKEREKKYEELLNMSGLRPFMKRLSGSLSGGMKQKLALSAVLLSSPKLLLLDEPTVGVDPLSRRELWKILHSLVQIQGLSVLVSSSYLAEAKYCQDIIVLDRGSKLIQGSPSFLEQNAKSIVLLISSEKLSSRDLLLKIASSPFVIDYSFEGNYIRVVIQKDKKEEFLRQYQDVQISSLPAERMLSDCVLSYYHLGRATSFLPEIKEVEISFKKLPKEKVIVVEKLSRFFGKFQAVKKISFSVYTGEIFGILGPNGAGKSTTFRMLCGLLPPTEGKIRVGGVDLRTSAAQARAQIGYVSQKFSLYSNLSVRQNLLFFSRAYGLDRKTTEKRIAVAVNEYELDKYLDWDAGGLPLGFQKRLAIACATLHEPPILFLDEPTSGMDPLSRREFWSRMLRFAQKNTTLLITTHYLEEAEYCDRLIIISSGKILMEGSPHSIKAEFRSTEKPNPTIEDAFIGLIERSAEEN
ncbi:ATP-binding cassette domain-containing protein [Methylacidiphilum caldifontis]|uniref:ABC transporter ATP-binding protein n=1 Tax=Methylacidiphilum caldifontis TaxID=2795386 RepID=A0A4Y8PHR6_9BACT|nr:ATP-binding cassette domain-containing protein [Methylacidiphilum caldifontis]TFE73279.1 ABC transporter ATP-binding protein [Methylacidiphilum caldifontis]